ncbi:TPR repeat-containing thioredoxin TTL4-like [Nicotiana tabacum]|uniref:Inactive TPR repeat-containing thioredoxin TTL3-like n=1 Tax=Nicotiana tabacum TaxID=4097 RepID=A0A1S3Z469_TOBAC|nr:PREDICTED: inactive TPR repeat-containing thioredoxin TTL3-like [Nicotiana tabacum]
MCLSHCTYFLITSFYQKKSKKTLKHISITSNMGDISPEKKTGCGLLNAVFGRRNIWTRRSTSTGSLPTQDTNNVNNVTRSSSTQNSKRHRNGSHEAFLDSRENQSEKQADRIIPRPNPNQSKAAIGAAAAAQNKANSQTAPIHNQQKNGQVVQGYNNQGRKVPQAATGISGELETMIQDHQRSKGANTLVRASSSNVMLFGNLGNIRQQGGSNGTASTTTSTANHVLDYLPRTAKEEPTIPAPQNNGKYSTSVMGNVVKKQGDHEQGKTGASVSLCRALSTRMDPEQLKILGNEDYKNGRFAEALALYDAAISIDPNKASYRSNKSAALTALGRLLEAVFECREAITIDPHYQRAHNRLATLSVRLGDAEKAMYHYKQAGAEADPDVVTKAKNIQIHLNKCTEAKRQRDWNTILKETALAISAGADSAPQIFALKAEAMVKLHRYHEADQTLKSGPNFDFDECTKFFGPIGNAGLLVIQAQVHLAAGRIDDALAAAQRAAQLDGNNKEVNTVTRRTRAVASGRTKGNELFKAGKYADASIAYGEGLDHDPYNSVLLCNRAACRSKLGQFEKALEDCNAALIVRPSFTKARLRKADCYFKMGKWEACIQECETLIKETPENEEVGQMIKDAQQQLAQERRK